MQIKILKCNDSLRCFWILVCFTPRQKMWAILPSPKTVYSKNRGSGWKTTQITIAWHDLFLQKNVLFSEGCGQIISVIQLNFQNFIKEYFRIKWNTLPVLTVTPKNVLLSIGYSNWGLLLVFPLFFSLFTEGWILLTTLLLLCQFLMTKLRTFFSHLKSHNWKTGRFHYQLIRVNWN